MQRGGNSQNPARTDQGSVAVRLRNRRASTVAKAGATPAGTIVDCGDAFKLTGSGLRRNIPAAVPEAARGCCTMHAPNPATSTGNSMLSATTAPMLGEIRHDWTCEQIESLFALPFQDLIFEAQRIHREHHAPNTVQMSTLLSVKTGACPEDCAYCPQSVRYETGLDRESLLAVGEVVQAARAARDAGATRFCMGAAWRTPKKKDMEVMTTMIREVRALGMETCATLGMLTREQAHELRDAGLDYYNHNIDSSPEFYEQIITTREFADRLETLEAVREAGMNVCCGGIVGMGETLRDRARMLQVLTNLAQHPESVPINQLVAVPGTPLAGAAPVDPFDFVRMIAVARIVMPAAYVRLSAGREGMSDELQALAFLAGANSIFYGEKLLTTGNPDATRDRGLLARLGIAPESERGAAHA